MIAFSLGRRGAHTLCYKTLQIGMNGVVLLANDVPARLGLPSGALDLLRKQVGHRNSLRCPDELLLCLGKVTRKIFDAVWL